MCSETAGREGLAAKNRLLVDDAQIIMRKAERKQRVVHDLVSKT